MFYALVYRKDGKIAGIGEATRTIQLLKATEDLGIAIALRKNPTHPVWPRQIQLAFIDLGLVAQQTVGLAA